MINPPHQTPLTTPSPNPQSFTKGSASSLAPTTFHRSHCGYRMSLTASAFNGISSVQMRSYISSTRRPSTRKRFRNWSTRLSAPSAAASTSTSNSTHPMDVDFLKTHVPLGFVRSSASSARASIPARSTPTVRPSISFIQVVVAPGLALTTTASAVPNSVPFALTSSRPSNSLGSKPQTQPALVA